jgi:hypothetical protein
MQRRIKRPSDICVICGCNPATSWDHIPPDAMFPKPKPHDPIEVPACAKCNSGASDNDQKFQVFIGLAAGHGEKGVSIFKPHVSRILKGNKRLKRTIGETLRRVDIQTEAGILLGHASAVKVDFNPVDIVLERIIRGMHFWHTGYILGNKVNIKINRYRNLAKPIYDMSFDWPIGSVGGNSFIYKYYLNAEEEPYASCWVLQFFRSAWFSGVVLPSQQSSQ